MGRCRREIGEEEELQITATKYNHLICYSVSSCWFGNNFMAGQSISIFSSIFGNQSCQKLLASSTTFIANPSLKQTSPFHETNHAYLVQIGSNFIPCSNPQIWQQFVLEVVKSPFTIGAFKQRPTITIRSRENTQKQPLAVPALQPALIHSRISYLFMTPVFISSSGIKR